MYRRRRAVVAARAGSEAASSRRRSAGRRRAAPTWLRRISRTRIAIAAAGGRSAVSPSRFPPSSVPSENLQFFVRTDSNRMAHARPRHKRGRTDMGGVRFLGAACLVAMASATTAAIGRTAPSTTNTTRLVGPYPDGTTRSAVDPLVTRDDDFARNRDPSLWSGLTVERITFRENRAHWAFWRIVNAARPGGVLWVVPHDNENGAFDTGLRSVGRSSGILIAVDTNTCDDSYAARFNGNVDWGAPIDPNRNFTDAAPRYVGALLADLWPGPRLIIALHSNAPGFGIGSSTCATAPRGGSGDISIRV